MRHLPQSMRQFYKDLAEFRRAAAEAGQELVLEPQPQLADRTQTTAFDAHYVYQGPWLFRHVLENQPAQHVDVGSYIGYAGFLAAVTPTEFIDIRPTGATFPGFSEREGSVLDLPFADRSVESISCLHVIEHVGLGRYGDPVDPLGNLKALEELQRVVAPGGRLYISTPIGRRRVCFNAHRVHAAEDVLGALSELDLTDFAVVSDQGDFVPGAAPDRWSEQEYACGLFAFQRPATT